MTLETTTLATLPDGIAGVNGVLRVQVMPGRAPLLLSKEVLKDLGCHIDLGRGHLFFEKLGVRAVVTSEQSPHLLLPLTSFGPQGHKIPDEIQPRVLTNVQCTVPLATARASARRSPETDSTDTESQYGTDGQEQNPCHETRQLGKQEGTMGERSWHRQTDSIRPMHDAQQPLRTSLNAEGRLSNSWDNRARRRPTIPGHKQSEMRSLWKGTTEFGTREMSQDDTWKPNRHHSHIILLFRSHLTRPAAAMPHSLVNTVCCPG